MNNENKIAQLEAQLAAARRYIDELESERLDTQMLDRKLVYLHKALENASDQFAWVAERDLSRFIITSVQMEVITGYPNEKFIDDPLKWLEITHPDDREQVLGSLENIEVSEQRELEYRIFNASGKMRWIKARSSLIRDEQGQPVAIGGIVTDITDRKEAEDFTRLQRDLAVATSGAADLHKALDLCMSVAMETSGADRAGIYLVNNDGSISLIADKGVSETFYKTVSYLPKDSLQAELVRNGKPFYVSVEETSPEINEACTNEGLKCIGVIPILYRERAVACMNTGYSSISEVPETTQNRLEAIAANLGGMIVRLEAEQQLREHEASMRAMLDAISESVFLISVTDLKIIVANETAARRLGTTVEAMVGRPVDDFMPQDIMTARIEFAKKHLTDQAFAHMVDRRDGRIFDSYIYPVFSDNGEISAVAIFAKDVTDQHDAVEKIAVEQRLLRKLIDLQERERTLVSHEIHDGVVQDIVAAKMFLNVLSVGMKAHDCEGLKETTKIEEFLTHAIAEARRLIRELRPLIIEEKGIVHSIDHLIVQKRETTDMRIEFEHNIHFNRIHPMLESNVYRIVQEGIRNASRHSQAKKITVSLVQDGDNIVIGVVDDGIGFDPKHISEDRFGVRGIRERARLFGGHANIESAPGEGTKIRVELPIELTVETLSESPEEGIAS